MKLFASKFYQTLVLNVATIAAIVVGLYQFAVRAFNENNGAEKVRHVIRIVLPEKSIRFTKHAKFWCEMINIYKKEYPSHSFKQIAQHFGLSESNTRRYYYGMHHANLGYFGVGYNQVRRGACVTL